MTRVTAQELPEDEGLRLNPPMQCQAAGCIRSATDYGWRRKQLLWAACDEHAASLQPKVDHRGRTLTVAGRMLQETATAAVRYRLALSLVAMDPDERIEEQYIEVIAEEVLEALCGTPPMRALLHTYLTEIEESRGAA